MTHIQSAFSGLSVHDIPKARDFYTNTLELELVDDKMGLTFALPGGGQLFLYEKSDHQAATFTVLNFVVADIDAAIEDFRAKGITFETYDLGKDMQQDEKGVLRGLAADMGPDIAWFKDPAGNVLALLQDS